MKYFFEILSILTLNLPGAAWPKTDARTEAKTEKKHEHAVKEDAQDHSDHEAGDDGHGHANKENTENKHAHDDDDNDKHKHDSKEEKQAHGESGHDDEGSGNVGPDNGILEASDNDGIKLSPEALKNFDLRTQKLSGPGPWNIPVSARLLSGEEVNIYRARDGFYKRIDFNLVKKTPEQITITSKDLKSGDAIVVNGIGFLRIAELAAFGGAPEGHSH